jgi:hypothetical protein
VFIADLRETGTLKAADFDRRRAQVFWRVDCSSRCRSTASRFHPMKCRARLRPPEHALENSLPD